MCLILALKSGCHIAAGTEYTMWLTTVYMKNDEQMERIFNSNFLRKEEQQQKAGAAFPTCGRIHL